MTDKPTALRLADLLDKDPRAKAHHEEAADELRRLHAALRNVYEVWAGSEAFEPVTAAEGYLLQLVKQMRDAAMEGMK